MKRGLLRTTKRGYNKTTKTIEGSKDYLERIEGQTMR